MKTKTKEIFLEKPKPQRQKQQTRDIKTRWRRWRLKSSSQSLWVGFFILVVDFLFGS